MISGKRLLTILAITAFALAGVVQSALAHVDVHLKDASGANVTNGVPYSPKVTCGTTSCHASIAASYGIGNIYEANATNATKDHGPGSPSYSSPYNVPYPQHGVSAGYHFMQGRNIPWGDDQRDYYGLPDFTSAAGMMGKY